MDVPALRAVAKEKGEFWVTNPWLFGETRENLSCYERNGVLLNAGDRTFRNLSYLSGADSDGDGRTVAAWDITGDGMPELFVRQAGGGALIVYENRFPRANSARISLRGTKSNSFGVGAKVTVEAGGKTIRRELYPIVNFLSQSPAALQIGLGDATQIERLTIRWPSGLEQQLVDLPANEHLLIREGDAQVQRVVPGHTGTTPLE